MENRIKLEDIVVQLSGEKTGFYRTSLGQLEVRGREGDRNLEKGWELGFCDFQTLKHYV